MVIICQNVIIVVIVSVYCTGDGSYKAAETCSNFHFGYNNYYSVFKDILRININHIEYYKHPIAILTFYKFSKL